MQQIKEVNWQNQVINWQLLQSKHAWQNRNVHYNLYLYGQEDLYNLKIIDFISYYFGGNIFKYFSYIYFNSVNIFVSQ